MSVTNMYEPYGFVTRIHGELHSLLLGSIMLFSNIIIFNLFIGMCFFQWVYSVRVLFDCGHPHQHHNQWHSHQRVKVGQSTPHEKIAKKWGKEGRKSGKGEENEGKGGKVENHEEKAKIRKGSFTLSLLTDRAGYATDHDKQH